MHTSLISRCSHTPMHTLLLPFGRFSRATSDLYRQGSYSELKHYEDSLRRLFLSLPHPDACLVKSFSKEIIELLSSQETPCPSTFITAYAQTLIQSCKLPKQTPNNDSVMHHPSNPIAHNAVTQTHRFWDSCKVTLKDSTIRTLLQEQKGAEDSMKEILPALITHHKKLSLDQEFNPSNAYYPLQPKEPYIFGDLEARIAYEKHQIAVQNTRQNISQEEANEATWKTIHEYVSSIYPPICRPAIQELETFYKDHLPK